MIRSSFPQVADQIITYNKNMVELLSKIDALVTTTDPNITVRIVDENGTLRTFTLPSFTALKADIDRLNNNINSLYGIDNGGSLIETANNKFKKLITVDLNREPNPISNIGVLNTFKTDANWFFENLMSPMISVELDLTNKIEDNVRKCLVKRYIVDFNTDSNGVITTSGQSALNSFNDLYRSNSAINIDEFEQWYRTTNGVSMSSNPKYDQTIFDLEPNVVLYDGSFNVLNTTEDRLNRKLWYVLNTLEYSVIDTQEKKTLVVGDEVIINTPKTSTRYKIIEISTSESNPRVRFERVEGNEAIPIGVGTLKIYSPVLYSKKLKVSIGYNERNVIFVKPINTDNNIIASKWSQGTGFYTNELSLSSNSNLNGMTMEQFYVDYIYDYGVVLKDMVAKNIPSNLGGLPESPVLNLEDFKVVQINKHLTDSTDSKLLKQKHTYQLSLKSEIEQLTDSINERNNTLRVTRYKTESAKKQAQIELNELVNTRDSKSKLLASVTQEIIDLSKNPSIKVEPKFRVRGFWDMPPAVVSIGTKPQEVIQFKVEYRYLSKDGKETPIETFKVGDNTASFSNWEVFKTDIRKRVYDITTGTYTWEIEDISDADTPNINQLDISIQRNERVEVRVKSISEVGYPDAPIESNWSNVISIEFPDDLNDVVDDSDFILKAANKEDLKVSMNSELSARGLDEHLSDSITINNVTFHHNTTKISSGVKDNNDVELSLFNYLRNLEDRLKSLEERFKRVKGELQIVILRNNEEYIIGSDSETTFNVECEDYLTPFTGTNVPTGRVYENNIYVIKDFVIKIKNIAIESQLGLLSNNNYFNNNKIYKSDVPQVFWVNNQDELLKREVNGSSLTHLNNQFIWNLNYDIINGDNIIGLSKNIGNDFVVNNSISNILSSEEYNVGYSVNEPLKFVASNNSLLDRSKWIDPIESITSTNKLLTTIHPVVKDLETIQENNDDKVKVVKPGDENSIIIPINIYFKMNALDTTKGGKDNQWVDLNQVTKPVKHIKKVKFMLENEAENRPFIFTLKFNLNRNKVIVKKYNTNGGGPAYIDDFNTSKK